MAVTLVTISGSVVDPEGVGIVRGTITCQLSQPGSTLDGAASVRVCGEASGAITAGVLSSLALVPNDAITPSGTYYLAIVEGNLSNGRRYRKAEKWQLTSADLTLDIGAVPRLDAVPGLSIAPYYVPGDASAMVVTAAGGTLARTLADRAADIINVKDFGAAGDAVYAAGMWSGTNDYAAVQAALTAGAGKTVYFPPGNYMKGPAGTVGVDGTTPAWVVPSNTKVVGLRTAVLVNEYHATYSLLKMTSTTGVTIEGLTLDGNHDKTWLTSIAMLVEAQDVIALTVRNCSLFRSHYGSIFTRNYTENVLIEGNYFFECGVVRGALQLTGAGGDSISHRVVNNHFEECLWVLAMRSDTGLPESNFSIVYANNTHVNCGAGLGFQGCNDVTVTGNVFTNDGVARPVDANSGAIGVTGPCRNVNIHGNSISYYAGAPAYGITADTGAGDLTGLQNIAITGNVIEHAALRSIGVAGTNISVCDNVIRNCGNYAGNDALAISASGVTSGIIAGNTMRSVEPGAGGIGIASCTDLLVSNNVVVSEAAFGTAIGAGGTNSNLIVRDNIQTGFQFKWDSISPVAIPYSASMTPNCTAGSTFTIIVSNATNFTMNLPTGGQRGTRITLIIYNGSGGAIGTCTWATGYRLSGWAQPANGKLRTLDLVNSFDEWCEISRPVTDVG